MPAPLMIHKATASEFRGLRPACVDCVLRQFCAPGLGHPRAAGFAQHKAQKGTVLYLQGSNPERVWTVCQGSAKLVHSDRGGQEDVLALMGPGTVFGHEEIFHASHGATAVIVQSGVIASMRKDAVIARMECDAAFARMLYSALAEWSEQMMRRATESSRGTSRQRLARLLLRLAGQFGAPTPEGTRITMVLQRREIAGMIGLEPETVTRLLGGLFDEGIVRELRRGEFLLADPARLHRMAHV